MSLIKSGSVVTLFTLLSRIAGLARELFIAYTFGASSTADSVNIAFKLPNLFRRVFGEGALSLIFIPQYNQKLVNSKKDADEFASKIFWILGLWLASITLVMEIFMPQIMLLLAPGFFSDPEKFTTTIFLCRITTPYLIFVCLTALYGGILNSHKKFALFAFIPSLISIMIIVFPTITKGMLEADTAMAIAVIIAGAMQISLMYIGAHRANASFSLTPSFRFGADIKKFARNMVPATLTAGVMQINLFISQSIASFLPGAVSILSYSERLYQFPLSMIGIAFGTVLLPELSRLYKTDNVQKAQEVQNNAIKLGLFLSLAAAAGIMFLSTQMIHLIYERGEFTHNDTINTAATLCAFAFGLPAFTLSKIFIPYFYATGDAKRPMIITTMIVIINTIANVILMQYWGVIGIAAGSSFAAWVGVAIMYYYAYTQGFRLSNDLLRFLLRCAICIALMSIWLLAAKYLLLHNFTQLTIFNKLSLLSIIITISGMIYLGSAYVLGLALPKKKN